MVHRIENGKVEFHTSGTILEFTFRNGEITGVMLTTLIQDDSGKTVDYITLEEKNASSEYLDEKFASFAMSNMQRRVCE